MTIELWASFCNLLREKFSDLCLSWYDDKPKVHAATFDDIISRFVSNKQLEYKEKFKIFENKWLMSD